LLKKCPVVDQFPVPVSATNAAPPDASRMTTLLAVAALVASEMSALLIANAVFIALAAPVPNV
jgi:hypothetical protein